MQIVLLGLTGSGKTTLAETLAKRHGWPHISTGAIARDLAKNDPATKLALERGDYAPESSMRLMVRQQLEQAEIQYGGYVLDGFPRTMAQWVLLQQWGMAEPLYILLDLPLHESLTRLLSRKRHDDIADAIAAKIAAYRRDTDPIIDMLNQAGALITVDGRMETQHQADYIRTYLP